MTMTMASQKQIDFAGSIVTEWCGAIEDRIAEWTRDVPERTRAVELARAFQQWLKSLTDPVGVINAYKCREGLVTIVRSIRQNGVRVEFVSRPSDDWEELSDLLSV